MQRRAWRASHLCRAARHLPRPDTRGVAKLPHENDLVFVRYRDDHHAVVRLWRSCYTDEFAALSTGKLHVILEELNMRSIFVERAGFDDPDLAFRKISRISALLIVRDEDVMICLSAHGECGSHCR